ncbi:hypothetical protein [Bacillus kexueae]|uniref:hypothetical protein n=1 Tax=Aeribacillus kexueae TaxID=2078952 RepID=UPI001FAFB81E|nr:hypothetical protein [Bacillus kexueae]
MKIPILEPAKGVYLEAIKKYIKFRQVPLMSADYEVNGEIYKFVGLYKKKWFGDGIVNRLIQDFLVVDQKGEVVRDEELTKRVLEYYCTFETIWIEEGRIKAALKHDVEFFEGILQNADELISLMIPVMEKYRNGLEKNLNDVKQVFSYLELWNEKSIELEKIARELEASIKSLLNRDFIDEESFKKIKSQLIEFVTITDIRSIALLDLYKRGHLRPVKITLSDVVDKLKHQMTSNVHLKNMELIVKETLEIVHTSRVEAIKNINTGDLNKIKDFLTKRLFPKEDMIRDYATEIMNDHWLLNR